jgi:phosphoserine phosphatase RsbU/P
VKILVADDDETCRALLGALLPKWGHEVFLAADGLEAWDILSRPGAPCLLILDWSMPGMDGLQLCQRARSLDTHKPFYAILLTGRDQSGDVIHALGTGADDYVTKPFDGEELRVRVQVGCRVLELQGRVGEQERLRGALQMAGTVCHELNQPLQAVLNAAHLLQLEPAASALNPELLQTIQSGVERLGRVTQRIMKISAVNTKSYLGQPDRLIDLK